MAKELSNLQTELSIGSGSNLTVFETNGVQRAEGGARTYMDEYPSGIWTPAANATGADPGSVAVGGVTINGYLFDGGNTTEAISNSFEIPHYYAYDTIIEAHLHFMPTTTGTGTIKFYFDWVYAKLDVIAVAQTALTFTHTIAVNNQYFHKIVAFGNLPSLGYVLGEKLPFTVRRVPTEDTYTGDVLVMQCALHLQTDTHGSRQIYVK